jgi:hypothetical protein
MSDTNDAGAAGSATDVAASEPSEFDKNFAEFLGHSFNDPPEEEGEADSGDEPAPEPKPEPTPAPASPIPAPVAAPASATPTAASDGAPTETPASGEGAAAPAAPAVDQADLAAMLGLASPATSAAPEPASSEPTSSSASEAEGTFQPFKPDFRLPPAMTAALFEAEDTETRAQALVNLLSAFGNTMTQTIEQRIMEHHLPQFQARLVEGQSVERVRGAVLSYFHNEFPELQPYQEAVRKAMAVVARKDPTRPTSPELMTEIGELTHAALKASGIVIERKAKVTTPAAQPKKAVTKTPPSRAPGSAFEAGGSRPDALTSAPEANTPASLLAELSEF